VVEQKGTGMGEGGMKKGGEDRNQFSNNSSDLTYFICDLRVNSHPRQEYLNIPAILIGPAS
jgi:hypothetical protein